MISIVTVFVWLAPYLIIGVAIFVFVALWKILKPTSKSEYKNHQSNDITSNCILDEKKVILHSKNNKFIAIRNNYEKNKLQEKNIKSVTDALISMDANLGYKMTNRILSFSTNYWNHWNNGVSSDLYDYIIKAARERCSSAKRDFVKKECRQLVQIVEMLKTEVPVGDIIRIVFLAKEKIKTVEIETNTNVSILEDNVIQQVANVKTESIQQVVNISIVNVYRQKDDFEVVPPFVPVDISEDIAMKISQVVCGLTASLSQIVNGLMINAIRREKVYDVEKTPSSALNVVSNNATTSITQIICGLNASLSSILNGVMVNAVRREEILRLESVPYWEHTYVYSVDELQYADNQQKRFYYYFKSQFLKGHYLDIFDNSNYAFVLMFDLANDYYKHRDYDQLKQQLQTLAEHYPVVERYIKKIIAEVVIEKERTDAKNILRSYNKSCGQLCRWIAPNETIEVQGIKLTRGNFYLGECFLLPNTMIRENDYDMYGEKRGAYIYGSVLNPNLPASNTGHLDKAFCSYNDMSPAWRYEYLMWLSGQKHVVNVPTEILLFYLYGCEIRMFIDTETKMLERWTILLDIIKLYEYLDFESKKDDEQILQDALSDFIVSAIYKYFQAKFEDYNIKKLLRDSSAFQGYYIAWRISNKKCFSVADVFDMANYLYDIEQIVPHEYISIAQKYFTATPYGAFNSIKEITRKENKHLSYYNIRGYFNSERVYLYYKMDVLLHTVWDIRDAIRNCYWNIRSIFRNYNLVKERCNGKETIAAIFLLPDKVKVTTIPRIQELISQIEIEMQSRMYLIKPIDWLLELWEYERNNDKSIHIEYADSIIGGLRRIGYDIIPDYEIDKKRFNFGDICVIYRNEKHLRVSSTTRYEQSVLFINLATQIVQADHVHDSDFAFIEQQLKTYNQTDGNYVHLLAFARWRFLSKKRPIDKHSLSVIKTLKSEERTLIGNALIMLACTNGDIHPKRINNLKKILSVLGLETDNIHSQVHRLLTDSEGFAVVEKKSDAVEFSIKGDSLSKERSDVSNVVIDSKRLHILEQQTEAAHVLLSEIFVDEEGVKSQNNESDKTPKMWMSILELLLTKEIWKRAEVESICKKQGLMLGAVLEQINDFAYEKIDDTVVEDDGINIYVTIDYKTELI